MGISAASDSRCQPIRPMTAVCCLDSTRIKKGQEGGVILGCVCWDPGCSDCAWLHLPHAMSSREKCPQSHSVVGGRTGALALAFSSTGQRRGNPRAKQDRTRRSSGAGTVTHSTFSWKDEERSCEKKSKLSEAAQPGRVTHSVTPAPEASTLHSSSPQITFLHREPALSTSASLSPHSRLLLPRPRRLERGGLHPCQLRVSFLRSA